MKHPLFALLPMVSSILAAPNEHAADDLFWSQASALLPNYTAPPAEPSLSTQAGTWGPVLTWPHTPVSLAILPNGKLLTYSGKEPEHWPSAGAHKTHWGLWNPTTEQFVNNIYQGHEMFCGHPVMRADGILQVMGGRHTVVDSSTFDWRSNNWTKVDDMNDRRWYTTAVALPDGDVTTFGGQGGPNTAERFDHDSNTWNRLSGIDWQPVSGAAGFASQNWPFIMVAPDGRLFHFGPTDTMHWIDPNGAGTRTSAGITVPGNHYPKDGAYCMYDSGKYLIVGGAAIPTVNDATNACYTVDLTQTPPVVQSTSPMANARSHHNLVALPSGEVLVLGGNTSGDRFSDVGSVFAAEVWNPETRAWRTLASSSVPRNYHSTATLLPDGRVFSGGGGFTSGNPNHPSTHTDAQIFTPPALVSGTRPQLSSVPEAIGLGSVFDVQATAGLRKFSMIRMIATTHGNTSDQRFLDIPFNEVSNGNYRLISNPKKNVMVPGYWMLFGVRANGTYSEAKIIHVKETIDAPNSGLAASYYDGTNFNTLKLTRTDHNVDFTYSSGSPLPDLVGNTNYSIRWTGWVIPDYTESYTFFTQSDDGVRLSVNNQQLINNWTTHGSTEDSGTITLQAGVPVPINLEYFQGGGAALIQLKWSSARTPKAIVPPRVLRSVNPLNEATVAADNRHELFIDGQLVHVGVDWKNALTTEFQTGNKTTLAIRATDTGGTAGVLGHFRINGQTVTTSRDWKVTRTAPAGWNQPGFDDDSWAAASEYSAPGSGITGLPVGTPAKWIWSSNNNSHNEVYLRYTIGEPEITALPKRIDSTSSNIELTPTVTAATGSTLNFTASNLPTGLSLNATTGKVSGSLLSPGIYNTTITVTDQDNSSDSTSFEWVVRLPGQGEGSLLREVWTNLGSPADPNSSLLTTLTSNPRYPSSPDLVDEVTSFPVGSNSGDYYGTRLRGFVHAPISGEYTFWLASDDNGSLLLSTTESPNQAIQIASVPTYTTVNQWTKFTSQRSVSISLVAGQKYYLEILQKEGGGADHINLAWTIPGDDSRTIVDGSNLSPWVINNPPVVAAISDRENTVGTNISFLPVSTDPEGDDLTFTASGLPNGTLLNSNTGRITGNTTVPGIYQVTYTATDSESQSSAQSFTWTINDILTIPDLFSTPVQTGLDASFILNPTGGTDPSFRWNFGDGSPEITTTATNITHQFTQPGRYTMTVTGTDANGNALSKNFLHLAHPPLTASPSSNSQPIISFLNGTESQSWSVNPDQDTVSVFDLNTNSKLAEILVGDSPRTLSLAPNNRVWVTNKNDATLTIIDPSNLTVLNTLNLPRGSQPHGVVHSPDGSTAWVALEARGLLAQLNPTTGALLGTYPIGSSARHLAISNDSSTLYISRFISPRVTGEQTASPNITNGGGFVVQVPTSDPTSSASIRLHVSTDSDFAGGGSGLPNYLGAPAISPAGDSAWIPSKKDNIQRGTLRNGLELDHDNTVRSIASRIDLSNNTEDPLSRIDFDNSGLPSAAIYGPYGLHLFVTLEGSRQVAVVDAYGEAELFRIDTDLAPQGLALSPDGLSLLVHNFMSRTVSVHDISALVEHGTETTPRLATLDATESESLAADVLAGKQFFYDSRSNQVSSEDYMSCASCHNDAGHDGRIWDFTNFGEGLRNTIDLRGRGGEEHGPLHWSANFDEFQDFENQIRNFAGGTGLLTNGTPHPSLGTPNGGRSEDLDALAAYLGSLNEVPTSPFREPDGELTPDALTGKDLFLSKGCVECHSGPAFTDSGASFHDIGTLTSASGQRIGATLPGLDTPSLLGAWAGAPYLHDGSQETLAGAISAHQGITVSNSERDSLVAYLQQLEGNPDEVPTQSLAFGGTPTPLPGRLQVENYDTGGPGISYSDLDPENFGANFGPNFRDEGVDLEASNDTGSTPSIGWLENGEWTQYTVTLTAGSYDIVARAASELAIPGSIRVLLDGNSLGEIDIASTGGWYLWEDFTLSNITVPSGTAILRLEFQGASFNLNWLELRDPTVTPPPPADNQTPFGGVAATIPGKIEAENFDEDGPGIAYLDSEEENFGLTYTDLNYRTSGVDIEASFDTNATPSVGWTDPGEWLEYTVEVTPGTYDLKARIASGFTFPGDLAVELDGRVLGVFPVNGTGDWYNWETLTIPQVQITETGSHILRLRFAGTAGFNLNWVEFDDGSTPPPPPTGQSPFGGTAHAMPGRVQAEDYDLGGEGIAYSDADPENLGGSYRGDAVDIEPSGDTDGGFNVGWFDNAQWMEYTLNTTPGVYQLDLRASSNESIVGDVRITLDGEVLGIIDVVSTGGWSNWVTFSLPNIAITSSGEKVLRLEMIGDAVNVNWFEFIQTAPASNLTFSTINEVGQQAAAMVDSDGDNTSNLLEFAFGSNLGSSSSRPQLLLGFDHEGNCCQTVPVAVGGTLGRNTYRAAGLVYTFQGSNDLDSWDKEITFIPNPSDVPSPPNGYHHLTFRLAESEQEQGYLRVLVEEDTAR